MPFVNLAINPLNVMSYVDQTYFDRFAFLYDQPALSSGFAPEVLEQHKAACGVRDMERRSLGNQAGLFDTMVGNMDSLKRSAHGVDASAQALEILEQMRAFDPQYRVNALFSERARLRGLVHADSRTGSFAETLSEFHIIDPYTEACMAAGRSIAKCSVCEDAMAIGAGIYVVSDGMGGNIGAELVSCVLAKVVAEKMSKGSSFADALMFAVNVWRVLWNRHKASIITQQLFEKKIRPCLGVAELSSAAKISMDIKARLSAWLAHKNDIDAIAAFVLDEISRGGLFFDVAQRVEQKLSAYVTNRAEHLIRAGKLPAATLAALKVWEENSRHYLQYYSVGDASVLLYVLDFQTQEAQLSEASPLQSYVSSYDSVFHSFALAKGYSGDEAEAVARQYQRAHPMSARLLASVDTLGETLRYFVSEVREVAEGETLVALVSSDKLRDNLDEYTEIGPVLAQQSGADAMVRELSRAMHDKRVRNRPLLKQLQADLDDLLGLSVSLSHLDRGWTLVSGSIAERRQELLAERQIIWDQIKEHVLPVYLSQPIPQSAEFKGPVYIGVDGTKLDDETIVAVMIGKPDRHPAPQ